MASSTRETCALFAVQFRRLLGKVSLLDERTSMAVAGSIGADGVVRLATVPDSMLAEFSKVERIKRIDVEPGKDVFNEPTVSRNLVERLIIENPCKTLTREKINANKLVGIQFVDDIWQDDGVFFSYTPTPEWRTAVASVLNPAKDKGVHPIGRAALMLKVLFAVAGIADKTEESFFRLSDVWKGQAQIQKNALINAVKNLKFKKHADLQKEIIAHLSTYAPTHKVMLRSIDLSVLSPATHATRGAAMFPYVAHIFDTRRTGADPDDSDDEGELPNDIATLKRTMFTTFHTLVVNAYKENFLNKFETSARIVGTKPPDWPRWEDGIHSLYSEEYQHTRFGKEYKHTPWAVSASFIDLC